MSAMIASSLRERRLECGLTQAELAVRAGVSRQLVAAVETGRNEPAVEAALGLARALATTVEELFADRQPHVIAALGGPLRDGVAVRVGRVGERLVAADLPDHGVSGAGWATPDGTCDSDGLRLFAGASPAGTVIAGCDPAIGLAETLLDGTGPRRLLAISAPTGTALRALQQGGVHAAIVHGVPHRLPAPTVPVIRWHLARWQVGLGVPPKLGGHSFEAVLRGKATIVGRDPAAASQQAFERARVAAGIEPVAYGPSATGHLDAARIAATIDGVAVTTASAARAFDLSFLPLEDHTVEIWVAARWRDHSGIAALGEVLATGAFTQRLARLGGYDLTDCGQRVDPA